MTFQKRTATWVIGKAFVEAQRKSVAPTSGTKYEVLLSMLDSEQKNWEAEPDVEWNSLYETVENGTVTATDTFDLADEINYISKRPGDFVTVGTTQFKLVSPRQLYEYRFDNAVCQIGQTLKFSKAFDASSSLIGSTISIPAILFTQDITAGTDLVECDDPMYLVYMLAANYIRSDVVKSGQYDNLVNKAANLMQKMKDANMGQYEGLVTTNWAAEGQSWD